MSSHSVTTPGTITKTSYSAQKRSCHGTQTLIASRLVTTGAIALASVGDTRTEADLEARVSKFMVQHPDAVKYHWVMDCLNTHQSEAIVRLAASLEANPPSWTATGKHGILKSMATRAQFLADSSHRLVVHLTPKHCSWLNRIELWFSILVRKLLRRASFNQSGGSQDEDSGRKSITLTALWLCPSNGRTRASPWSLKYWFYSCRLVLVQPWEYIAINI